MNEPPDEPAWLDQIRGGDGDAWRRLIDQYESRLIAYAARRVGDRVAAEDIVQETFVGFLLALPNFDARQSIESFLYSICSHKLIDHLRKTGRRPRLQSILGGGGGDSAIAWTGPGRVASSIARSRERHGLEAEVVGEAIAGFWDQWQRDGATQKARVIELIFVAGRTNAQVAETLGVPAQRVANYKSDFLRRLGVAIAAAELNLEVFPELQR